MRTRLPLVLLLSFSLTGCALFRPHPPEYAPVVLESGLWMRDLLVPESGAQVRVGDSVAIHFDLRLEDNTLIESTWDSGEPVELVVGAGEVPAGLEEGLIGMRVFGRRQLVVPPDLAYGDEGRPPLVPPEATLRFEIELMGLEQAGS